MKGTLFIIIPLFTITALFVSCEESNLNCNGKVIVENEIPDISLELGGEPFIRDVFEEPVVFRHTVNLPMAIIVYSGDNKVINAIGKKSSIVEVRPVGVGSSSVTIVVRDECLENEWLTSFEVTVVDSIQ